MSKHYEEVQRALRQAGVEPGELSAFLSEATSGDYDNLLLAAMRWVGTEGLEPSLEAF